MKRVMLVLVAMSWAAFGQTPNIGINPAPVNITIQQGASWSVQAQFKDGTGAVIDLTAYTVTAQIRPSYSSPTVLATITCTKTNPAQGIITLSLTATQTAALAAPATAQWDLFLSDSATPPNVLRVFAGNATIVARVTR